MELRDKFNLPSLILDSSTYRDLRKQGVASPFDAKAVVITSMNYAARLHHDVQLVPWDLVVIDEAHKLRGAYQPSNRTGRAIRTAIADRRKILLTATPLQNSLVELYGLSTLIDEFLFGELSAFRSQYLGQDGDTDELKTRLRSFCHRTLRRDVLEYVKYTERKLLTQPFQPTDDEQKLYEAISAFLQRDDTYSVPQRQRELISMVLRKLLASSSQAVASTLEKVRERLLKLKAGANAAEPESIIEQLIAEDDLEADLLEDADAESPADEADVPVADAPAAVPIGAQPTVDRDRLNAEIAELDRFINWARSIRIDTKSKALLTALKLGFAKMVEVSGLRKAVVFTESRKTQDYLRDFLEGNGYAGKVVLFNGTNTGPDADRIYKAWVEVNTPLGRVSGSKTADRRQALIEHFRDDAEILIATESAAEGVNLQFCSLIVNYDLPWNPQRIEQRIGRCHRYGQKCDVVVVNLCNERNQADVRVLQLLSQKFNLFDGVFGASDEVLGTIESGVDFEKKVHGIVQTCRTPDQIDAAFTALQKEMESSIATRVTKTRKDLLEHFDEDVHDRLKMQHDATQQWLGKVERVFWDLTKFILRDLARFDDEQAEFDLTVSPRPDVEAGHYRLISRRGQKVEGADSGSHFIYRLSHPLGEHVVDTGRTLDTPVAHVQFHVTGHHVKVAVAEELKGKSGHLILTRLDIRSDADVEEHLLFNAATDDGAPVDPETCEKLFSLRGTTSDGSLPDDVRTALLADADRHVQATITASLEAGNKLYLEEVDRLDKWADDQTTALEQDLKRTKDKIKALQRESRAATSVQAQKDIQQQIADLERRKKTLRREQDDREEEITAQRDSLIGRLEQRMVQTKASQTLFTLRWSVV